MRSATAELVAPVTVAEIELADPPSVNHISVAKGGRDETRQALVLVRWHGQPLTTIVVEAVGGVINVESCTAAARAALRSVRQASFPVTAPASTPPVTVVVATRERTGSLAVCLDSLARLAYPDFEVIVVDNDPVTDNTANLIRQRAQPNVRYVQEKRRGLAAAHNCGLTLTEGKIVAFTDDDVIVDRHWLTEIARAFEADANVGCVTGLIMPAELQTPAQILLESHGRFSKGFEQRIVDLGTHRPANPLFPFTAGQLGSGANMSFYRDKLCELGGFDPAIGAGTVARGGDDLAAFFTVIASGLSLVYQPSALVWHHHRQDFGSLARQAYGYGVGLGAYLTSTLAHHPAFSGQALRRAPSGLAYAFGAHSPRYAHIRDVWPRELTRLEWRGLAFGPLAYGISRRRTRGVRRPHAGPSAQ